MSDDQEPTPWEQEQQQKRARVRALLVPVAPALSARTGLVWTVAAGDHDQAQLVCGELTISAGLGGGACWPKRATADRMWLHGTPPAPLREFCPRHEPITVALTRAPGAIAQDIALRLLPAYQECLAKGGAKHAEHVAREARRRQALALAAQALGQDPPPPGTPDDERSEVGWRAAYEPGPSRPSLDAKTNTEGSTSLHLQYLPQALAAEVLAFTVEGLEQRGYVVRHRSSAPDRTSIIGAQVSLFGDQEERTI